MVDQKAPNPLMVILLVLGFIIIIAGIYFIKKDMTSSGVTMGGYGRPYGTGTINGKGMVFCGIIIAAFGLIFRDKKEDKDHDPFKE